MKVTLNRLNDDYLLQGDGASGTPVFMDNKTGDTVKGASPMELLLMAVGGCASIDIISILKKQRQEITSYRVEVEGARMEVRQAKPFEAIHVIIHLEGDIAPAKAKKAGELSFEKYCSVSLSLEDCVRVSHQIIVNGENVN